MNNFRAINDGATNSMAINFKVSDPVLAQIQCIADEREWTLSHVLRKIIPLGLDAYLELTTLSKEADK